jgi:hypothetical protein
MHNNAIGPTGAAIANPIPSPFKKSTSDSILPKEIIAPSEVVYAERHAGFACGCPQLKANILKIINFFHIQNTQKLARLSHIHL